MIVSKFVLDFFFFIQNLKQVIRIWFSLEEKNVFPRYRAKSRRRRRKKKKISLALVVSSDRKSVIAKQWQSDKPSTPRGQSATVSDQCTPCNRIIIIVFVVFIELGVGLRRRGFLYQWECFFFVCFFLESQQWQRIELKMMSQLTFYSSQEKVNNPTMYSPS